MRAKEKGKMRAAEDEQDSDYGGSQESYEGTSAQDCTTGNTPGNAIELLSDEDDAEGEPVDDPREHNDEDSVVSAQARIRPCGIHLTLRVRVLWQSPTFGRGPSARVIFVVETTNHL